MTRQEFYDRISRAAEGAEMLGDIRRIESANQTTYSNAADVLIARGVLTEHRRDVFDKKGKPKGQERLVARVEDPASLERLREALSVSGPLRGSFGA